MKHFLTLFCAVWLFVACNDDNDKRWKVPEKASRSVLVYMAGENNLTVTSGTRFLRNDLNEIIEGSKLLADDQRLFVFVDSLNTDGTEPKGTPYIIEVHGGEVYERLTFDHDFYACDPAYFRQVVKWMTQNAQADSYGLVLWGHASGWVVSTDTIAGARTATRAYGQDDGTDASAQNLTKWMNISQMVRALQGLPKLEFIFADCCNMMSAEVGYELRGVTKYLIGSPAEIPGDGAPYHQVVPYLFKDDSELYRGVIDTYYDYYIEDLQSDADLKGYSVPLSVIDTREMEQLAAATNDVLTTFAPQCPQSPELSGLAFYWYYGAPIMYDMKAVIKANADNEAYTKWESCFRRAVPYSRMSMKWMTIYDNLFTAFSRFNQDESLYGGVSMYVPLNNNAYYYGFFRFNATYGQYGWNKAVDWSRFGW